MNKSDIEHIAKAMKWDQEQQYRSKILNLLTWKKGATPVLQRKVLRRQQVTVPVSRLLHSFWMAAWNKSTVNTARPRLEHQTRRKAPHRNLCKCDEKGFLRVGCVDPPKMCRRSQECGQDRSLWPVPGQSLDRVAAREERNSVSKHR